MSLPIGIWLQITVKSSRHQQLILGTLTVDGSPNGIIPAGAKKIQLTDELHLLQKTQYAGVLDRIGKMHEQTLAAE